MRQPGMTEEIAEELFRQVAAFASFGFAKSHAAAFARTAYESAFLKLFYPAQFLVGLINAQPMGFYPVEVLVNDTKRHGVAVLPVDINASSYKTTTEWVGRPGEPLPDGAGIDARPGAGPVAGLRRPVGRGARPLDARGHRRLGRPAGPAPRQGDRRAARGARWTRSWRAGRTRAWPTSWSGPGCPRRSSSGSSGPARWIRWAGRGASCCGSCARSPARHAAGWTAGRCAGWAGRPASAGRRPGGRWTCACPRPRRPTLPADHRVGADRRRLRGDRAGCAAAGRRAVPAGARPAGGGDQRGALGAPAGPVRIGGLVVTRQHPMTAKGTVFLALEDETGMVNVTLWPDTWARLRGVVRRHALLLVDGELQREGDGGQRHRPRRPATPRGGRRGRGPGSAGRRPPDSAMPGCAGSADRGVGAARARPASAATGSLGAPERVRPLALLAPRFAAAWRPRFGFDSWRKRRYQAAPAANRPPRTGDRTNAAMTTSRTAASTRGAEDAARDDHRVAERPRRAR